VTNTVNTGNASNSAAPITSKDQRSRRAQTPLSHRERGWG
jgi:hypothetical protein